VKIIKIQRPFYSAWKKFGWDNDTWGVTLPIRQLITLAQKNETVKVEFENDRFSYEVTAQQALSFVESNNTQIYLKVSKKFGVIPLSIMRRQKNVKETDNPSNN
jgi:hypothetical protein